MSSRATSSEPVAAAADVSDRGVAGMRALIVRSTTTTSGPTSVATGPTAYGTAAYTLPSPPPLVRGARSVVGRLAALLAADAGVARRNAWEAVCADRERRRQWTEAGREQPVGR